MNDIYPKFRHDEVDNPYTEKMITDVFDMIIENETDEYWIGVFRKVSAKYIEKAHDYNKPIQPRKPFVVPDVSKKGKKGK